MYATKKGLISRLSRVKEVKQIGLTYQKELKIDGNTIIQETRVVGYINSDYASSVKRKSGKAIAPMKRSWGERIKDTPLVEHKGEYYLSVKVIRSSPSLYYSNGKLITDLQILARIAYSEKHRDEIVKIRDYNLDNIKRLTLGGKIYNVK